MLITAFQDSQIEGSLDDILKDGLRVDIWEIKDNNYDDLSCMNNRYIHIQKPFKVVLPCYIKMSKKMVIETVQNNMGYINLDIDGLKVFMKISINYGMDSISIDTVLRIYTSKNSVDITNSKDIMGYLDETINKINDYLN